MPVYKTRSKTKDGRQWIFKISYVDLLGIQKQYLSKQYMTKKETEEEEAKFILKTKNNSKKELNILALQFLDKIKIENKESTYYGHSSIVNSHIISYFKSKDIFEITTLDCVNWHNYLDKKGYSTNYKNKCHMLMKSILQLGMKLYGLKENVEDMAGIFKEKKEDIIADEQKIRYITYEEFKDFISVVDNLMWKTFFSTLYFTGMRKGEVQALSWNDLKDNQIIVNKTLSVKTKQKSNIGINYKLTSTKNLINRKIDLDKNLIELLNEYHNEQKKYENYSDDWFIFGGVRFLAQTTIDKKKHHYFNLSGVNEITIHEFRHSHVSLLASKTKDYDLIASRLGHSIPVMLKIYQHFFPDSQKKLVDILENL